MLGKYTLRVSEGKSDKKSLYGMSPDNWQGVDAMCYNIDAKPQHNMNGWMLLLNSG